eukprot:CAMPEP_0184315122 /NCGR_PEP_ID=MMETSP1049-20130417/80215_1 /TAXON_ID=77928 /ORGANISM="Proteomonas sulcata, Strain CCMP704" /LENGTH=146 /DNA_ID=CAMNT_0026633429 /DNA_START=307 /DNA_END=747 /DNA_ORIENTATION=+
MGDAEFTGMPGGTFLRDGGAVDNGDLMWSKQHALEQRVIERYARISDRNEIDTFRRQQESATEQKAPSALLNMTKKPGKEIQQKKILSNLISVKGSKRPAAEDKDKEEVKKPKKEESKEEKSDKKDESAGLSALAAYSDDDEDDDE